MPLKQSEAIILQSFNVGEQDKMVIFFTRDKGIVKGIAKGARKFGNRFGSSLEPFSLVKIFYYEKERKDLVTVSNCDLIESFFDLQRELRTSFTLSYFSEIIQEFSPARAKDDKLYRLLLSTLDSLKKSGDIDFLARYFEAWLLKIHGVLPEFQRCQKCRTHKAESFWLSPKKDGVRCDKCALQKKEKISPVLGRFIEWIKINPPPKTGISQFNNKDLKVIKDTLQSLIIFHLEKTPKTIRYL